MSAVICTQQDQKHTGVCPQGQQASAARGGLLALQRQAPYLAGLCERRDAIQ